MGGTDNPSPRILLTFLLVGVETETESLSTLTTLLQVRIFQHGFLQGWGPRARLVSTSVPRTKDKPTPSDGDPSTYI